MSAQTPRNRINISGAGSVSAAGWGVPALKEAILTSATIPSHSSQKEGSASSRDCATVYTTS